MLFGKKLIGILSIIIILTLLTGTTLAKSVYVIIDRDSTIRAYKISGEEIEKQIDVKNLDNHGNGAVGLALDPDSETLFVTFEGSNIIEMVNAKAMQYVDTVTATGASNLADTVADKGRKYLNKTNNYNIMLSRKSYKEANYEKNDCNNSGNFRSGNAVWSS